MIRSLYYAPGKPLRKDIPPAEFPELIQHQQGLLWVDFASEPPEICQPVLQEFKFHPLAIDDALQETHIPKLDDWGDYLYIVLNYMHTELSGDEWETEIDELDIFLGKNYIVTHHDHLISAVDETWAACDRDERNVQNGADHLLYRIADNLVAGYMPAVEKIDDAIDQIEDQVFDRPSPRTLEKLFALKRVLLAMRRIILPQREVLNKLARDDYQVIDPKDR
ncbi:MAG TPA: magnesium transporter CorA family protein, partial [Anaerolineales bacterium]|nr:magnesium transporter CorA family protein [Anaerolineales bacterium]